MHYKSVIINTSDICTFYIVIIPLIMFYKFPFFADTTCVTIFTMLLAPVFMLKILEGVVIHKNKAYGLLPLFLCYYCWILFKCLGLPVHFITMLAAYIFIVAVAVSDIFNINLAVKIIETVSIIATVAVLLQFILHYTAGMTSQTLFIHDLVNSYLQRKIDRGWSSSFFRPSAFFSEPSYFAQYSIIGVNSLLFLKSESKANLIKAIFITIGILITTSGIGIVLSTLVWLLWYSVREVKKKNRDFQGPFVWLLWYSVRRSGGSFIINVFSGLVLASLIYFIAMHFSFFSNATQRIFGNVDGYNAIHGRLFGLDYY
ncbi:MAG: hypothetical protein FWC60_04995, partial [Firmicutes bacterium]|nr:hypothetical protein [Bacillota bacterium]